MTLSPAAINLFDSFRLPGGCIVLAAMIWGASTGAACIKEKQLDLFGDGPWIVP